MVTDTTAKPRASSLARPIMQRTRGQKHGPATRLMSPSDFGEILKPFVFLDLFDHQGAPFEGGLHPHSGGRHPAPLLPDVRSAIQQIDAVSFAGDKEVNYADVHQRH